MDKSGALSEQSRVWNDFWEQICRQDWLYIVDEPLPGTENMARDRHLLETAIRPVLRLYAWERPTVSLGYAQKDDWVDRELLDRLGVDLVRRPTGGRALLHLPQEITYAVILPGAGAQSVRCAFKGITSTLAKALARLGVPVDLAEESHTPAGVSHPSCLEVAAPGEIIARGRKLVGSAQVRASNSLLQHGAIPRCADAALLAQVIPGGVPKMDLAQLGFGSLSPQDLRESWKQEIEAMRSV